MNELKDGGTAVLADGSPELYPGHAAEVARRERRNAASAAANAEPLPGPLLDAFGADPVEVAGLRVRPVVHYDFVILRKLDSPLLKQLTRGQGEEDGGRKTEDGGREAFTDEQGYEMVYQFTRPVREVAAVLSKGRGEVQRRAVEEIGYTLGPVEVALLVKGVEREFVRAFSTGVKYEAKAGPAEDGTVFTVPPATPTTASAGGSTISAS